MLEVAAGNFYTSITKILVGYYNYSVEGKEFSAQAKDLLKLVANSVNEVCGSVGTTFNMENPEEAKIKNAIIKFGGDTTFPKLDKEVLEVAATFYDRIRESLFICHRYLLKGGEIDTPTRNILCQLAEAMRKIITETRLELNPRDANDKKLGDALQEFLPKRSTRNVS